MILIKEVCIDPEVECKLFDLRRSVRCILLNDKNEVTIMNNKNFGWYCLPGGTMEKDDDQKQCLMRECLEEAGADIEILDELGFILEQRNTQGRIRIDYYYVARIVGELKEPKREANEIEAGMTTEFHTLEKAVELIRNAKPLIQVGKYQQAIDLAAIEFFMQKQ